MRTKSIVASMSGGQPDLNQSNQSPLGPDFASVSALSFVHIRFFIREDDAACVEMRKVFNRHKAPDSLFL